jgi:hypothetical protein
MNADGTNPTRLTSGVGKEGMAIWTPDGTKIAFAARKSRYEPDDPGGIFVMNADGSGTIRLTSDTSQEVRTGSPSWAVGSIPDGFAAVPAPTEAAPEPATAPAVQGLRLVGSALTERADSPLAGVWVHGDYAYVGSQNGSYHAPYPDTGIRIVGISDPANDV